MTCGGSGFAIRSQAAPEGVHEALVQWGSEIALSTNMVKTMPLIVKLKRRRVARSSMPGSSGLRSNT
jgi:hypothetical protein